MFVLTLIILFKAEIPVMVNPHHPGRPHYFAMRWYLVPHLIFGSIAMLAGPLQFSTRFRQRSLRVHRILGRVYVASIAVAAPFGAAIVIFLPTENHFRVGVCVHASLWFITTAMAYLTARNRHIVQHRQWMIRSYVLTFSFILSRVIMPVWLALGVADRHNYGIVDVTLNVCYLLGADIAINWREISRKRA